METDNYAITRFEGEYIKPKFKIGDIVYHPVRLDGVGNLKIPVFTKSKIDFIKIEIYKEDMFIQYYSAGYPDYFYEERTFTNLMKY